ncbi:unnamed protein product, partial [Prorocentrum cordatum]
AIEHLAVALAGEEEQLLSRVHVWLRPLVGARRICLVRELSFLAQPPDFAFLADYMLGMPKFGWACHAPGMEPRLNPPEYEVDHLLQGRSEHNGLIVAALGPAGDDDLDERSWQKSKEEFVGGALIGPFVDTAQVDLPVRLAQRFPTWELRSASAEWKVRSVDNFFTGGQNGRAGAQCTHVPATIDTFASVARATAEAFLERSLVGFPSDFTAAFRQCTADPAQAHLCAVACWDTDLQRAVFGLAVAQLFGGKSAGLNFCRIPAWCARVTAYLYAIYFVHCVDDVLAAEAADTTHSARASWRKFADVCGWLVENAKSPPPAPAFAAIGAYFDLAPLPRHPAMIRIAQERCERLRDEHQGILGARGLHPGHAARLVGRLGFASIQLYGRVGRAMVRALRRRQYECRRFGFNPHMRAAILWWLDLLEHVSPKDIPHCLQARHTIVSFSDGEGAGAGIGIAVWDSRGGAPIAGYTHFPRDVRRRWQQARQQEERDGVFSIVSQHSRSEHQVENIIFNDIYEIEIAGWTWNRIWDLEVLPRFDRVESASNPVDGMSRRDMAGPWVWVLVSYSGQVLRGTADTSALSDTHEFWAVFLLVSFYFVFNFGLLNMFVMAVVEAYYVVHLTQGGPGEKWSTKRWKQW